jgi:transcriptional regulator with XRE-family HTH domain
MDDDRFGFFVKQRRKALDLTQDDLARLVGCAAVTIQKIEEGRRRPSKQVAALLADYLAVVEEEREAFLRLARRVPPSPIVPPVELQQPVSPTNLPAPLTPLIGRATEVAAVWNYLIRPDIRLVSLV